MFPITIQKVSLKHRQGTKEYHLVLLEAADGKSVVINRWGKTGAWGQMKVEELALGGRTAMQNKVREKEGRGYAVYRRLGETATSEDELKRHLGPQYWAQIGASALTFLVPEIDTVGVKDPENPEFEQIDGRWVKKEKPPKLIPDPEPTVEEQVSKNPLWGMF